MSSTDSNNILELLDPTEFLVIGESSVLKMSDVVIGGKLDAIIVYATKLQKNYFTDIFINTYRVLLTPKVLLEKLGDRFQFCIERDDDEHQFAAIESLRLFERIFYNLIPTEYSSELLQFLYTFFQYLNLSNNGFRKSALIMSDKLQDNLLMESSPRVKEKDYGQIVINADSKSRKIAKLIGKQDYKLFNRIQIVEVIIGEGPNLQEYLQNFDKLYRWTVNQLISRVDKRSKLVIAFDKLNAIKNHLKKKKYFNSYYAILSAVYSDSIRNTNIITSSEYATIKNEIQDWQTLNNIQFCIDGNYPCIPHVESFVDLIAQVNTKYGKVLDEDEDVINMERLYKVNHILMYWKCLTMPEPIKDFYPFCEN